MTATAATVSKKLTFLEMLEQSEQLAPLPKVSTVERLEELMVAPCARSEEDLAKGHLAERDPEVVKQVEVLTRRMGIMACLPSRKRIAMCKRMNIIRLRSATMPLFEQGERPKDFFICLAGAFEIFARIEAADGGEAFRWTSKVPPGGNFYCEMGIGGDFGCPTSAYPYLISGMRAQARVERKGTAESSNSGNAGRRTRIKPAQYCVALCVHMQDFLAAMEPDPLSLRTISLHIHKLPYFSGWPAAGVQGMAVYFEEQNFEHREPILQHGQKMQRLYILVKGSVQVLQRTTLLPDHVGKYTFDAPAIFGQECVLQYGISQLRSPYTLIGFGDGAHIISAFAKHLDRKLPESFMDHLLDSSQQAPYTKVYDNTLYVDTTGEHPGTFARGKYSQGIDPSRTYSVDHLRIMQQDGIYFSKFLPLTQPHDVPAHRRLRFHAGLDGEAIENVTEQELETLPETQSSVLRSLHSRSAVRLPSLNDSADRLDLSWSNPTSPENPPRNPIAASSAKSGDYFGATGGRRGSVARSSRVSIEESWEDDEEFEEWGNVLHQETSVSSFTFSSPPRAIRRHEQLRASRLKASEDIPTLLDTTSLYHSSFDTAQSVLQPKDDFARAAGGAAPAGHSVGPGGIQVDLNRSFLPLYFPLNHKYISQLKTCLIKMKEAEFKMAKNAT